MDTERMENIRYTLFLQDGTVKDCIFDGKVGGSYCFTTRENEDKWNYCLLEEEDFRRIESRIEVLTDSPRNISVSKELEPMEFLQVQQAWDRVWGEA
jgi:hypothetical protein